MLFHDAVSSSVVGSVVWRTAGVAVNIGESGRPKEEIFVFLSLDFPYC
jgi:hypothetical protein